MSLLESEETNDIHEKGELPLVPVNNSFLAIFEEWICHTAKGPTREKRLQKANLYSNNDLLEDK